MGVVAVNLFVGVRHVGIRVIAISNGFKSLCFAKAVITTNR